MSLETKSKPGRSMQGIRNSGRSGLGRFAGQAVMRTRPVPLDPAKWESDREGQSFFRTIEQFKFLRSFQKDLYLLTGLPFDFVDLQLRSSPQLKVLRLYTPFCTVVNASNVGRLACECDDKKRAAACIAGGSVARRCHLGLIEIQIPMAVNGRVIGLLCAGQLLYQTPTQQGFQRIEKRLATLGVDVAKAREAYFKLPVLSKCRVSAIIGLIRMVSDLIGTQQLHTMKAVAGHHPLSRALDYMEANYTERLSLPTVAKVAGLSASRLAHVFQARLGMSFTMYLNTIRINWAKYYLTHSNMRIGEAAFQVGFGNLSHFNHMFRRATGFSPNEYRRQQASTSIQSSASSRFSGTSALLAQQTGVFDGRI